MQFHGARKDWGLTHNPCLLIEILDISSLSQGSNVSVNTARRQLGASADFYDLCESVKMMLNYAK
jgi:hypothetical protein